MLGLLLQRPLLSLLLGRVKTGNMDEELGAGRGSRWPWHFRGLLEWQELVWESKVQGLTCPPPRATPPWSSVRTSVTCGPRAGGCHSLLGSSGSTYCVVIDISSFLFLSLLLPVPSVQVLPPVAACATHLCYHTSSLCHAVE